MVQIVSSSRFLYADHRQNSREMALFLNMKCKNGGQELSLSVMRVLVCQDPLLVCPLSKLWLPYGKYGLVGRNAGSTSKTHLGNLTALMDIFGTLLVCDEKHASNVRKSGFEPIASPWWIGRANRVPRILAFNKLPPRNNSDQYIKA